MKNLKKATVMLCSLGLLFGIANAPLAESKFERFKKDGFFLALGTHENEGMKKYTIEIKRYDNIKTCYDGDIDFHFEYYANHISCATGKSPTEFDKNGDGWIKVKNKWAEIEERVYKSHETTGTSISDISYKDVPGSPKINKDTSCRFWVDFDENEEHAAGSFVNKEYALEWADNMIKIFKSKNYEKYK
jgi:hypothetical protein